MRKKPRRAEVIQLELVLSDPKRLKGQPRTVPLPPTVCATRPCTYPNCLCAVAYMPADMELDS